MIHIETVEYTNKSQGTNRVTGLGNKTLIVGPNEGHKSALIEAMMYRLYGAMPDVANRNAPVRSPAILKTTTADGSKPEVRLLDSNGAEILPGGAMMASPPYMMVEAAFSGSAEKANEFVMRHFDLRPAYDPVLTDLLTSAGISKEAAQHTDTRAFVHGILERRRMIRGSQESLEKIYTEYKARQDKAFEISGGMPKEIWAAMAPSVLLRSWVESVTPEERAKHKSAILATCEALGVNPKSIKNARTPTEWAAGIAAAEEYDLLTPLLAGRQRAMADLSVEKAQIEAMAEICSDYLDIRAETAGRHMCNAVNTAFRPHDEMCYDSKTGYVGVIRKDASGNPVHHYSPSGSVQARLLGAIAAAIVPDDLYGLVALPDRAWDDAHLTRTMQMLGVFRCQIVIANTFAPKKVPKGWTVVEVR